MALTPFLTILNYLCLPAVFLEGLTPFIWRKKLRNLRASRFIYELAEKVVELTNSESEIRFEPLPEDDPRQRQPDITLARQTLGWESKVPLEEGLKRTIAYFDGLLSSVLN